MLCRIILTGMGLRKLRNRVAVCAHVSPTCRDVAPMSAGASAAMRGRGPRGRANILWGEGGTLRFYGGQIIYFIFL